MRCWPLPLCPGREPRAAGQGRAGTGRRAAGRDGGEEQSGAVQRLPPDHLPGAHPPGMGHAGSPQGSVGCHPPAGLPRGGPITAVSPSPSRSSSQRTSPGGSGISTRAPPSPKSTVGTGGCLLHHPSWGAHQHKAAGLPRSLHPGLLPPSQWQWIACPASWLPPTPATASPCPTTSAPSTSTARAPTSCTRLTPRPLAGTPPAGRSPPNSLPARGVPEKGQDGSAGGCLGWLSPAPTGL